MVLSYNILGHVFRRSFILGKRDALVALNCLQSSPEITIQKRGIFFRFANEKPPRVVGYYLT